MMPHRVGHFFKLALQPYTVVCELEGAPFAVPIASSTFFRLVTKPG